MAPILPRRRSSDASTPERRLVCNCCAPRRIDAEAPGTILESGGVLRLGTAKSEPVWEAGRGAVMTLVRTVQMLILGFARGRVAASMPWQAA